MAELQICCCFSKSPWGGLWRQARKIFRGHPLCTSISCPSSWHLWWWSELCEVITQVQSDQCEWRQDESSLFSLTWSTLPLEGAQWLGSGVFREIEDMFSGRSLGHGKQFVSPYTRSHLTLDCIVFLRIFKQTLELFHHMNCKPRWFQSADCLQEDQTQSFPNNSGKRVTCGIWKGQNQKI